MAGEALVVEQVAQLERVPVVDRLEELDVTRDLAFRRDDEQAALLTIPEASLGELTEQL